MMYRAQSALWELDFSGEGFRWLDLEDRNNSIISFARYGKDRDNHLVGVFNYTPQTFSDYKVGLPTNRRYRKLFSSDSSRYGGSDAGEDMSYSPIESPYAQAPYHTTMLIPPLSGLILEPIRG
jgi:1,4-alpha-glucan branching enzyme